jgi:transcriptional regulator with XRE-family HTH domain
MKVLGNQVLAARGLLRWSQRQLAVAAEVTEDTIAAWERGEREPRRDTVAKIVAAFWSRGVEFTNGGQPGVRFKAKPEVAEHEGVGE